MLQVWSQVLAGSEPESWPDVELSRPQVYLLCYHYFSSASKIPMPFYVGARIAVAFFLFLTGFGHMTYFMRAPNFDWYLAYEL